MSDQFPPDDDPGPEMTPHEAFSRASEKSAQPSEPSEGPAGPVSAEELDQAILGDFPGLTREKLDRMMNEA